MRSKGVIDFQLRTYNLSLLLLLAYLANLASLIQEAINTYNYTCFTEELLNLILFHSITLYIKIYNADYK